MNAQNAKTVLMIEPLHFGFNPETAVNNHFQNLDTADPSEIQKLALNEFRDMVNVLETHGIKVIVVKDTPHPLTPDSIFPNNWLYVHDKHKLAIFPMFAENRRHERRLDIIQLLEKSGIKTPEITNYSPAEMKGQFLEGTGSMVLDRESKIAYAAISERTNPELFHLFCKDFGYEAVLFHAYVHQEKVREAVYHTNIMMSIGQQFAVVCPEIIEKLNDRLKVLESFEHKNKKIIQISEEQVMNFAGNLLQLQNADGKQIIVLSKTAYNSLYPYQLDELREFGEIVPISIPNIEKYGGGSVRCMLAEIIF